MLVPQHALPAGARRTDDPLASGEEFLRSTSARAMSAAEYSASVAAGPSTFLPFEAALAFCRPFQLQTFEEWEAWTRTSMRPSNIPARPDTYYQSSGFRSWNHWLAKSDAAPEEVASPIPGNKFLPFSEATIFARGLRLADNTEWIAWCKDGSRPAYIPSSPHRAYKHDGWQGWAHWLGTDTDASASSNRRALKKKSNSTSSAFPNGEEEAGLHGRAR